MLRAAGVNRAPCLPTAAAAAQPGMYSTLAMPCLRHRLRSPPPTHLPVSPVALLRPPYPQYCSDVFSCTGDYKNITAMSTTIGNTQAECCTLKTCADYGASVCPAPFKTYDTSKGTTQVTTASAAEATCCTQLVGHLRARPCS